MTTYARTATVPDGSPYITPEKLYKADCVGAGFYWVADNGKRRFALWRDSGYLDGGNWERVELPDEPAASRWSLLTIEELEADREALDAALAEKKREALAQTPDAREGGE